MATGYTSDVAEKDISFEEFTWKCAKAFSAFNHMRDERSDAKIVLPPKENYYAEALAQSEKDLKKAKKMTLAQAEILAEESYQSRRSNALKYIESKKVKFKRYQAMLDKVNAWTPPTKEHQGLKKFMVCKLEDSIVSDCDLGYLTEEVTAPRQTAQEFIFEAIESIKNDISRYLKESLRQETNYQQTLDWINKLIESVPPPKSITP